MPGHTIISIPGIFKLGRVSTTLKFGIRLTCIFFTSKGWCSGDSCLDKHLSKAGRLSICAESCAAEQALGGRYVAVAFPFFHNSFVSGDNGRMVCLYER